LRATPVFLKQTLKRLKCLRNNKNLSPTIDKSNRRRMENMPKKNTLKRLTKIQTGYRDSLAFWRGRRKYR